MLLTWVTVGQCSLLSEGRRFHLLAKTINLPIQMSTIASLQQGDRSTRPPPQLAALAKMGNPWRLHPLEEGKILVKVMALTTL